MFIPTQSTNCKTQALFALFDHHLAAVFHQSQRIKDANDQSENFPCPCTLVVRWLWPSGWLCETKLDYKPYFRGYLQATTFESAHQDEWSGD